MPAIGIGCLYKKQMCIAKASRSIYQKEKSVIVSYLHPQQSQVQPKPLSSYSSENKKHFNRIFFYSIKIAIIYVVATVTKRQFKHFC